MGKKKIRKVIKKIGKSSCGRKKITKMRRKI